MTQDVSKNMISSSSSMLVAQLKTSQAVDVLKFENMLHQHIFFYYQVKRSIFTDFFSKQEWLCCTQPGKHWRSKAGQKDDPEFPMQGLNVGFGL